MKLFRTILFLSMIPMVTAIVTLLSRQFIGNGLHIESDKITVLAIRCLLCITIVFPVALSVIAGIYKLPFKSMFYEGSFAHMIYVVIDAVAVFVVLTITKNQTFYSLAEYFNSYFFGTTFVVMCTAFFYSILWLLYMGIKISGSEIAPREKQVED